MTPHAGRRRKPIKPKTPIMWLVIIALVSGLFAFILGWQGGAVEFIEDLFHYRDDSYQPKDLERVSPHVVP